ncbi:MAG: AAA family ATPase, partial [Candidatus Heimdallarchaeota archaeon]
MAFNPEDSEFSTTEPDQILFAQNLQLRLKNLKREQRAIVRQNKDFQKLLKDSLSEINKIKRTPLVVATVQEVLDDGKVIIKTTTGQTLLVNHSSQIDQKDLVPGIRCALNQRHLNIIELLYNINDPLIKGMEILQSSDISYSDIGGLNDEINEVVEIIELSLNQPEKFSSMGISAPKGCLLYGPSGNGKTLIAKAIAKKTNSKFISLVGSELVQKYIGEGARLVRELFHYAKENGPSVIFIDEIDAIGSRRLDVSTSGDREVQRTFMQLLSEIDGFKQISNVKIIGATNRLDILDPALVRNGRFDRHILIPTPTLQARKEIFEIHTRKINIRKNVDLDVLAKHSEGFSGSDIKFVSIEAGLHAIRNRRVKVKHDDFLYAIEKMKTT